MDNTIDMGGYDPETCGLYRFSFDCGRHGELEGLFFATKEEIKSLVGRTAYFGEVLGKHSDIEGELEEDMFQLLDIGIEAKRELLTKIGCNVSGYDPRDFVDDSEDDLDDEEDSLDDPGYDDDDDGYFDDQDEDEEDD